MAREVSTITSVFSPYVLSFIGLLALIITLCVKTWKKERLISFGFLWFFIILLPRTNILKINRAMYEHWLYLPMAGFFLSLFLLILFFANKIKDAKKKEIFETSFYTIFLILAFVFCILTIGRNKDWRDPITFYEKNLRYTPNSYIQHNNLGMAYAQVGRSDIAIREYKKAIEIKDVYPQVHYNYGNSLVALKKYQEAEIEYKKAIEMSPGFLAPYINLFSIYLSSNDADGALELIDQSEEIFGNNINYLKIKAEVYYYLGHDDEAKEVLEKISEK